MKIVLINLHGDTNVTVAYLHTLIEKAGFDITTIHFRRLVSELTPPTRRELETLKKVVDKLNPEAALMSVNSISFWNAVVISKMLADRKIVWGGIQPLIDPERCLDYADIIIRGEGDEAVIELLNALKNKKSIDKIKNLWKKNGKLIKNDFRPLVENLDNLPFPDFTDRNKLYILGDRVYTKNPLPHSKYEYNITFSRGCPFSCKYCINHYYNKTFKNKYLRRRSADSAIKELVLAKKMFPKIEVINFWDDVFMTDIKWLREFVERYKKEVNLPFFAYGNARFVSEESMLLLKKAGINFFDLGIQSGSERIRKGIFGRLDTNEEIIKADRILHRLGITRGYDVIFSEFETEKDMEEGLNFFLKLKKPFKVHRNKLAYYPNFEITKTALELGKISIDQVASINPDIKSQVMNKSEAEKVPLMNYYYFIGRKLIPNFLVKYMIEHKVHRMYPKLMTEAGELINRWEHFRFSFKNMFNMLYKGEFSYVYNRLFNKKEFFPM